MVIARPPTRTILGRTSPRSHIDRLNEQIANLRKLAAGERIDGAYVTRSQLLGRIAFIVWIAPRRGLAMRNEAKEIDWGAADKFAKQFGPVEARKRLIPKAHVRNN